MLTFVCRRSTKSAIAISKAIFLCTVRSSHSKPLPKQNESSRFDFRFAIKLFDRRYKEMKPIVRVEPDTRRFEDPVFVFPGFEGRVQCMLPLTRNLGRMVYCLQYPFEISTGSTFDLAKRVFPYLMECLKPHQCVNIVAHSLGGFIALDTIRLLEKEGINVKLCLTDSSPYALKYFSFDAFGDFYADNYESQFLTFLLHCMDMKNIDQFRDIIESSLSWHEKTGIIAKALPQYCDLNATDAKQILDSLNYLVRSIFLFEDTFEKLKCETTLIKPVIKIWKFPDDYKISRHFLKPVNILYTDGHHVSMIKSPKTAAFINEAFESRFVDHK